MSLQRFGVTPQLRASLLTAFDNTVTPIAVSTSPRLSGLVSFITKLGPSDSPDVQALPTELTDSFVGGTFTRTGFAVRCEDWTPLKAPVTNQAAVREFLKERNRWPWSDDDDRFAFVLLVDDKFRLRPIALATGQGATAYEYQVVELETTSDLRQPERNRALTGKRVAVIGLGSVGSKLALTLARSGVSKFLLIDDDILQPGNLSRNQLDWLSVGFDKVDGVRGAIRLVQPDADVQTRTFRFAGQESASLNSAVLEQVAACDLVIDATANSSVFSSLAAVCTRRSVPLVWGELFSGGIGALMARSIPGVDAEPLAVRAAINAYLSTLPEAPLKHAQTYDAVLANATLVAGDAEVSQLAASMTQFAIDALVLADERRFPVAAYLFGYQEAWVFEAPFDTRPITCPSATASTGTEAQKDFNTEALTNLLAVFGPPTC
ncbi:ThiF family adenylyltransferase [Caballeronia sp. AZ7_KS35]|uniref:HesA/MoeB/ThiF family protein n=1 Tax=Caballeronia sp. AZ7_KS35 TaxID=2921762 RepID=UPI002027F8AA|nr:ThiF family adenylyltransferase [Caballeronia sp. AZ7_KS35]